MIKNIKPEIALSLDDVLLKPQRSDIHSRLDTDLTTQITETRYLKIPIMIAPMPNVAEEDMFEVIHH